MTEPLKITEVQRLVIQPGDRLIATVNRSVITEQEAAEVKARLIAGLRLDASTPVIVVPACEWDFTVLPASS